MLFFCQGHRCQQKSKRAGRCSIKLSAEETLYPQLLWQLWKTAISALCIIVHAPRWGVSEETTEPSSSVHGGTFVIVNHQHFCMQKGHFPISCHEITLPACWWRPALEAVSTQFILRRDNSWKKKKKKWGLRIKGPFIWRFICVNILLLCFSNWWIGQNLYMRLEFSHMHHFNILQNEDYAACISFLIWWAVMLNKSTFFF